MYNTTLLDLELKDDAKPVCLQPYPATRAHEAMFKKEYEIHISLWELENINIYKWGALSFYQPKSKANSEQFLSDFRNLNIQLYCKPYSMPKIRDLLLKLEGFKYSISLELNTGYYNIHLSEEASSLCTIILPRGKHQ